MTEEAISIYEKILSTIPESLDFNFISVKVTTSRTLTLNNPSDSSILFKITNSLGYIFSPSEGIIPKNKSITITVSITPNNASVLVANAQITLDDKYNKIFKLSSIAKYPYLTINREHIDFGIIEFGKVTYNELIIINSENVSAKFEIERTSVQPGKNPQIFFLSALKGEIPPQSSFLVYIKYITFFPNVSSYETYNVKVIGGNTINFSICGSCSALRTYVNVKYVNFKTVELGKSVTRLIRVYNDSDTKTEFQIFHNNDGAFKIDNNNGVIMPRSNKRIIITFKPYETILYYERIFILIRNHVLYALDIYGACHDLLNKTLQLNQKFVDTFRYKLLNGEFFGKKNSKLNKDYLPDELKDKENEFTLTNGKLNNNTNIKIDANATLTNLNLEKVSQLQLHKELLWEITSNTRIISLENEHIDFHFVACNNTSDAIVVRAKNNTNFKVKIKWILERPIITNNLVKTVNLFLYNEAIFIIQPEEIILGPNGYFDFKLYFKPNKKEYYFYSDIPCQATIIDNTIMNTLTNNLSSLKEESKNQNDKTVRLLETVSNFKTKSNLSNRKQLKPISNKTCINFTNKAKKILGITTREKKKDPTQTNEYFNPPITTHLSVVGHSFPPDNQIFIPMYELNPKNEIFFSPASINQSMYQTLKIINKSDTPLFFSFSTDPSKVFRMQNKYGLIEGNQFKLILIEFCPKDTLVYRYPLRIMFNHDTSNIKTIILNGLCVDPVIEIQGVKNDIFFPPSFLGITTKKKLTIINRSPIRIKVKIICDNNEDGVIEVQPNNFEMDRNLIKDIEVSLTPLKKNDFTSQIHFHVERLYESQIENIGIFNPGSQINDINNKSNSLMPIAEEDKREFIKTINVLGKGSDGSLTIKPNLLEFGTVKVGFNKKLAFSIYNPTITNFYIKLETENIKNENVSADKIKDIVSFDFTEGLINSFCKREITVTFKPISRSSINIHVLIYATEHNDTLKDNEENKNNYENNSNKPLKCELDIKANGDYPLIKICDVRNDQVGINNLWHLFNVDEANEELQKQLTEEEINYNVGDRDNKKINEMKGKLKCIKFDFGKHIRKKNAKVNFFDVYLTLKNEGGVSSEFYFKFPDDINIKREIWMDPVEPTSNDKVEYHVLKEKIFEIEPRRSKLEPNECCNIRLRYNFKEKGNHKLRVIFQIVNGKPLIFELNAVSFNEKQGMIEIKKPVLNFSYVPIGYMDYIVRPFELYNVGGIKIRYKIDDTEIRKFNEENHHFEIFKIEETEGSIGPGDYKYIAVFFRPLTSKEYILPLTVYYIDDINHNKEEETNIKRPNISQIPITIKGHGYHPLKFKPDKIPSPFLTMPNDRMCNVFNGEIIQKCGISVEEIDFGECDINQSKNQTFILYNFSNEASLNFDFRDPGFILKDEIEIKPNKDKLERNSHILIKMILTPKGYISNYDGEIDINITWNAENSNKVLDKEVLHIRIRKQTKLKEIPGSVENTENEHQCFIETVLTDLTREILCEESFQHHLNKLIDDQPLGIYDWTNDIPYPSNEDVRDKIISNYFNKAKVELNSDNNNVLPNKRNATKGNSSHLSSNTSHYKNSVYNPNLDMDRIMEKEHDIFGDEEDLRIQEKYTRELLDKYKLTIPEVNESLALVNQESRKLISNDIMETTIYNIISEAVYGETDLTEKTRIYFFNK